MWDDKSRAQRFYSAGNEDQRAPFERDRDRVLYSSAFHRLAGITQIVRAGEADVFHTRQQHSVKVAQIGRRISQKCIRENPKLADHFGLHEEVVEAACLAHDLGHPPFGHVGETELDRLMSDEGDPNGFEGNAQSFRIVTTLSVRYQTCDGLDLTRASLAACLKYPWLRDKDNPKKSKKWSAYDSEKDHFEFAREHFENDNQSLEAALMDWADDIAYSVHDLEDFHRCGALPWQKILDEDNEATLVNRTKDAWFDAPAGAVGRIREALRRLKENFFNGVFYDLMREPYEGSREQRQQIRTLTSALIGRYVDATTLVENTNGLRIDADSTDEIKILKQITRDYIISSPSLAAQQYGQRKIIRELYRLFSDEAGRLNKVPPFTPKRLAYLWEISEGNVPRFAADCIASLSEHEIVRLHGRLFGSESGSVLDPIVR